MATLITGASELRRKLKALGPAILKDIAPVARAEAASILAAAQVNVPVDEGELALSAFTSDEANEKKGRVMASAGYEAAHAAYAHEGFHYGKKVSAPPKWLERAADGREQGFADAVGKAIRTALARLKG